MFKIDELIYHPIYGRGNIVSISKKKETLLVCFEKEFEVLIGEVIDTDHYFEDTRRLETTKFIEVCQSNVEKVNTYSKVREPHCHNCTKLISNVTHDICKDCRWIICDCGSCGCNYYK